MFLRGRTGRRIGSADVLTRWIPELRGRDRRASWSDGTWRRAGSVVLVGLLVLPLACEESAAAQGGWTLRSFTPDGSDSYSVRGSTSSLTITAATGNTGRNLRVAAIHDSTPISIDQEACVTWEGPSVRWVQPGIVLRASDASGHLRAIMVSNNIAYGTREVMNVHLVDTSLQKPLLRLKGPLESPYIGDVDGRHPLPWRFCARAQGERLVVKAWSVPKGEPSWDDDDATASVTLPNGWVQPGRPGVYVGHLAAGEMAEFSDVGMERIRGGAQDRRWDDLVEWTSELDEIVTRPTASDPELGEAAERAAETAGYEGPDAAIGDLVHGPRGRAEEIRWVTGRFMQRPSSIDADSSLAAVDVSAESDAFSRGLTDRQYVERVHRRILDRSATGDEILSWVEKLSSGRTRASVARSIWRSAEHRRNVVVEEYTAVFGEAPTEAERDRLAALWAAWGYEVTMLRAHLGKRSLPAPNS